MTYANVAPPFDIRYAIVGAVWFRYWVSTSTSPTRKNPSSSSVKWMRERSSRSFTGKYEYSIWPAMAPSRPCWKPSGA